MHRKEVGSLQDGRPVSKTSPIANLGPFVDNDALVRWRLQHSGLSFEEKHPIILPQCHVSLLLFRYHHVLAKLTGVETVITVVRSHWGPTGY